MHVLGMADVPETLEAGIAAAMRDRGVLGIIDKQGSPQQAEIDGGWRITAEDPSKDALLEALAPRCDFAIVRGEAIDRGPNIAVSDGVVRTDLLEKPRPIDDVSAAEIVDELERTEPFVTLESLVTDVKAHPDQDRSGAIATFTGRVREKEDPEDTPTEYLEFEQYGDIAHEELGRIRQELLEREDVFDVRMHHRSGVMHAGEDIVFVVVLAGHREQAFRTVKDGINRLKAEVPIFKKEVTVDEEFWVHNRP